MVGALGDTPPGAGIPVPEARHLTFESLDTYWAATVPVEIPVPGEPVCRLRLDPRHDQMSLLVPLTGAEPNLANLRSIELNAFVEDDESWAELRITVAGSLHAAFGILVSVADRMQLAGESLAVAVPRAIAEHRGVLAGRVGLSAEQEIGLYGELLLLESLMRSGDPKQGVDAWAGPLSEEHDFVLDGFHVEVKTTSGERRKHVIGNLQQLEPLREVPLWLLSIQITRSAGTGGRTLTQLVRDVRALAGESAVNLDSHLTAARWNDGDRELFTTVWTLRSTPRSYRVDGTFPALTEDRLLQAVPRASFLSDVSYRVDVTDLDKEDAPLPVAAFLPKDGTR